MVPAMSDLPTPDSPDMRTVVREGATAAMVSKIWRMRGSVPTMLSRLWGLFV